jgi:fumarate reductase subunit D
MKRANDPIFWALFGAGGMLAALVGPLLIWVTGIGGPGALLLPERAMDYQHVQAFAQNYLGKLLILVAIALFLFHGCHRLFHSFHDVGIHGPAAGKFVFFGFASLVSLVTLVLLLSIHA